MNPAIIAAIIAGGVSVAGAILSVWTNRHTNATTRDTAERVAQLEETRQIRAEQRTKDQLAEQVQTRYREPLLLSAFELQSRIWNMMEAGFRPPSGPEHDYLVEHTQYLIAQYLGWVEVMRREVQFLDLGEVERTHELNIILDRIAAAFATMRFSPPLRLFRGQQEAIAGEVISVESAPPGGERLMVIGFSEFARRLQNGEAAFVRWFTQIKSDLEQWAIGDDTLQPRLISLQNSLMDLIQFFDPQHQRFPRQLERIELTYRTRDETTSHHASKSGIVTEASEPPPWTIEVLRHDEIPSHHATKSGIVIEASESWTIEDLRHPERTPEYRAVPRKIDEITPESIKLIYGAGSYRDYPSGSLWLKDANGWFMVSNLAGIPRAAQFCADPSKVDLLRQNAKRLYDLTSPEVKQELDQDRLLDTPITDAGGVARWADSIFNSGFGAAGTNQYPGSIVDIQLFKYDDFNLWVTDEEGNQIAVAPMNSRGSGDARVRVLYAPPGSHLEAHLDAVDHDQTLVLGEDHPLSKQAYGRQEIR